MADYIGSAVLDITATAVASRRSAHHGSATLTVTATGYSGPIPRGGSLEEQCEAIWAATRRQIQKENLIRTTRPLVRIWDAEWDLQFVIGDERKATFSFISNDTGPGQLEIPFESPCAQWIHAHQARIDNGNGRNVGITVDYCGARWGGVMDKYTVNTADDGDVTLIIDFNHDYEHLKWRTVWSNPFTPPAFQFPRAFALAGPVNWVLKTTLFLNIVREHNPLLTLPDDPMDISSWDHPLDMSQWNMVVNPTTFVQGLKSGVVWGILISRWANWHDAAHQMLEDSELSVRCDRWLEGDPPPWPGAPTLRNGCLVIDIIDKSGIYVGTANGGTMASGLVRTVYEFADDFIDSSEDLAEDTEQPTNYHKIGYKYTDPRAPYCIYIQDDSSPIQSSQWINSPAKGVVVACGGHSMPGVNEMISATIQASFDLLGNLILIGSLGSTVDSLVKPLYEDVVLAWWSVLVISRARDSGWDRLFEYFQQGADKAYTITALMVLRAALWSTRTVISWKVNVLNGLPFMVGDRGIGQYFLDDRVGLALRDDKTIHMDRARKIDLAWDDENYPEWEVSIGDERIWQDPGQRAWGKIETMIAGLRDLGVW